MKTLNQSNILVVDDTKTNIDILVQTLGEIYDVRVALDGQGAINIALNNTPDLILLDIVMSGIDGYEVCRVLKSNPKTKDVPIIFLSALDKVEEKTKGFKSGAVDFITKPFSIQELKARVETHLSLMLAKKELSIQNIILDKKVHERTKELELTQDATICSMAVLAEYRDPETGGHIQRTKYYVKRMAELLKKNPEYSRLHEEKTFSFFCKSAPLHDIGKVGIPDNILLKHGPLNCEEFEVMRKHTIYGKETIEAAENILNNKSDFLRHAKEIAFFHHEKWDGSGYPLGIRNHDIPVSARLMAIADVYDALISKRVYKLPFSHKKALKIISEGDGTHFDPVIVEVFLENQNDFREIAYKHADFEEERANLES